MLSRRELLVTFPAVLVAVVTPVFGSNPKITADDSLTLPLFQINQRVKTWYDFEDLQEPVEATGIIRGLCWQPEKWLIKVGWVYNVWFFPHPLLDSDEWQDEIPEFDLKAC